MKTNNLIKELTIKSNIFHIRYLLFTIFLIFSFWRGFNKFVLRKPRIFKNGSIKDKFNQDHGSLFTKFSPKKLIISLQSLLKQNFMKWRNHQINRNRWKMMANNKKYNISKLIPSQYQLIKNHTSALNRKRNQQFSLFHSILHKPIQKSLKLQQISCICGIETLKQNLFLKPFISHK